MILLVNLVYFIIPSMSVFCAGGVNVCCSKLNFNFIVSAFKKFHSY